jgi:hypothetical protein
MQEFWEIVHLNFDQSVTVTIIQNAFTNNITISHSGQMLAQILSLFCPEKLFSHTVGTILLGYGIDGTLILKVTFQ